MIEVTKDLCVYCLCKSVIVKETSKYRVGLCDQHKDLNSKDIDEILGDFKPRIKGKQILLR